MNNLPQAPTITDVARHAGVSFATAARALGGYGSTSADARARVERSARDLGYRPNSLARSMKTGRTQTVGFVGADIDNPFFARALQGATDTARASGFEVILVNTEEDVEREQSALRLLSERRVDGIVISPVALDDPGAIQALLDQGTAVVCLDRSIRGVATDTVMIDNVRAAHAGVAHLIAQGHRRIGVVAGRPLGDDALASLAVAALDPLHTTTTAARTIGYLAALRAAGIEPDAQLVAGCEFSRESSTAAARRLLATEPRPTALFAVDNLRTLGAYEAILESELAFPAEVSLLGFDDLEWTTIVRPSLSVVAQPAYELGAAAARLLVSRLGGDRSPPQMLLLESTLVHRDSVAAPASA
jgi:LacI family transcriptional regulator